MADKAKRPGRNERCHCGSGKKYKQCCLSKDETVERTAREKAAAKAAKAAEKAAAKAAKAGGDEVAKEGAKEAAGEKGHSAPPAHRHATAQPWKRGAQSARGGQRISTPRKVGSG